MKHPDWKQAGKGIAFATVGRLLAEVLIWRYKRHQVPQAPQDRICPHLRKGKPLKLRVVLNGDWHQFCAVCVSAYGSIFEVSRTSDRTIVVGIKSMGSLEQSAKPKPKEA